MCIIVNKAITPDGTVLNSRHTWDFVSHTEADGRQFFLDGGLDYVRCSKGLELITLTDESPHDLVREHFSWGSYGKNGDEPLHYIPLKDMDTEHLMAVLSLDYIKPSVRSVMENEVKYREVAE